MTADSAVKETHREESVDDVGLDGAQRFVSDHHEDLLLFLQVDEVPKPGLLGQSAPRRHRTSGDTGHQDCTHLLTQPH